MSAVFFAAVKRIRFCVALGQVYDAEVFPRHPLDVRPPLLPVRVAVCVGVSVWYMSVISQIVLVSVLNMHCVVVSVNMHTVYVLCVYVIYVCIYIYTVW